MKKLTNHGETIVEVLIAIAIVGGVLSAAYYLLNRSYSQSQASIERVAATKLAESKVEVLRTLSINSLEVSPYNNGTPFCLSNTAPKTYSPTDTDCVSGRYTLTVRKNVKLNSYEISAEWDGLLSAKEKVVIYFRP